MSSDTSPAIESYVTQQLITCIGNKRVLIPKIARAAECVLAELGRPKISIADLFSGSSVVARQLKRYASALYVSDLESYATCVARSSLSNRSQVPHQRLKHAITWIEQRVKSDGWRKGFIAELYAPTNDASIQPGERVFYTRRNAIALDTYRQMIDEAVTDGLLAASEKHFLLAPLISKASIHVNTSGVFKGFHKNKVTGVGQFGGSGGNALTRILGEITLQSPVFSEFECKVHVYQGDANIVARELPELDLVYLDPPYNQHPYGSNYFMLNLVHDYQRPLRISRVSGIPDDWRRSDYNKRALALRRFGELVASLKTRYLLVSFNDEGFIEPAAMRELLRAHGELREFEIQHNTFRGSRNLRERAVHVNEHLYLVRVNA